MNDPSPLAATNHGDRDALPAATPEPTFDPPTEPPASPAPALHAVSAIHPAPDAGPAPAPGTPPGTAPAPAPGTPPGTAPAPAARPDGAPAARPAARVAGTADPAARPGRPPAGAAATPPGPAPQPPPVRATVPVPAPTAADAMAARAARRGGVLGHVLRWPTAAALLFCGVLHLPGNLAQPPEPGRLVPLAVALLCLPLGALLAVRDTPAVWRGAAVATLAVVALHIVGGVAYFNPLDGTLGAPYPWAGVATVLGAATAAILAGVALTYRPPCPRTDEGA
ncbi:hypothetical protein BX286_0573 [Streptomyces sp. 3211.6]|uniref:hypothetical protein n=1 Tax=Streptomyces sp. 3211.6 TaxID=1938845 RepID=UPI000F11D19C|nr:hypothetical protein [Streptomyces sp. 3211.6]RKT02664.1 hypothetical protein BX286_0573 [Streptomyces sp. 3211.6]